MAIANKLTTLMPAFGAPTEYITSLSVNIPINATTTTALTGFTNFVRSGRVRFKSQAALTASQLTGVVVTATDGTSTVTLYADATTRVAANFVDFLYSFISELNLTTVSVALTLANVGGAATVDFEITGNP
jgi:hypothetical protein